MKRILLVLGLLLVLGGAARAQIIIKYLSLRAVVGGGGQILTRQGIRLDYTVGQPLAGPLWADRVELRTGFWPANRPHSIALPVILREGKR